MYVNVKSGHKITDDVYSKLNKQNKAKYQKDTSPEKKKTTGSPATGK